MYVYILFFGLYDDRVEPDEKIVGVFSSRQKAKDAIHKLCFGVPDPESKQSYHIKEVLVK